ncbi:hypothetical protein K456DRAFT_43215 [Colletotrichum gloeosporioides 23]|nr:hypothetical protein K456DRAFT_43215 [Colletotrichum gloeosporioides 23]
MAEPTVTTNIPAPAGPVADNGEDVSPEAAKSAGNNSSRGAAVLRRFVEDLEKSKEGAKEVGMFREWIQPMLDDDDFEEGLDMRDSRGKTLLHIAAIEGLAETAKRLIDAGAVLDVLDERGDTPLIDACGEGDGEDGHIEVVKLLLKKGARAGIFGNEHESPLYRAVINGHHRIVQYLLSQVEWDLDVGEEIYNITPLHAASAEDGEMVRYLRDKGARLDLRDTDGWTPLMTAIASRKEKAMEELLRRRNDEDLQLETEDSEGRSPILRAAKDGFLTGLRLLMEAGANVNVRDQDKRQPLHLACTGDGENGQYNEVIQLLLDQNPRPYTETVMKEMENAVELAFEYDHNERAEAILDILAEASPWVSHTLLWAAGETKRHKIALSLLKRQLKGSPPPDAESSEGWTAIEWATYARELPALWLLIASSPQNKQTKDILKSVQVIAKKYKLPSSEKQKRGQAEDPKKRGKGGKISLDIQDILDDPPTGLICTDDQTYDPPDHTGQHFPSMEIYKAAIVRFYKERGQFGRIVRFRALEDTIYQQGPGKIMSEVLEKFEENLRGVEKGIAKNMRRSIFMDLEPKFTWIHLPATNMMWMNHLVQRIMKDEDQSGSHFNQAKSFFKDSWIESSGGEGDGVDEGGRESARGGYGADGNESGEQKQKKTQDEEATAASSVASTAIYSHTVWKMPFLSYSFECAERTETFCPVDGQTEKGPGASENPILSHTSQKDPELEHKGPEHQKKSEQTNDVKHEGEIQQGKESEYAKAFQDARKRYQELLDEYNNNMNGNIIHGSSTLDESYYHFGEDLESTEDRNRRNGTQVATESWLEQRERNKKQLKENNQENMGKKSAQTQEGLKDDEQANEQNDHSAERKQRLGPYWLLIRVNQLWIWTINDKWLISASSHPIDGSENELFQGILDRLERQGEAGGSDLQPGSTAEMSQLIIDYCVDSYERKPKAHDDERPEECKLVNFPSIRQTFSKSINSIVCQIILEESCQPFNILLGQRRDEIVRRFQQTDNGTEEKIER